MATLPRKPQRGDKVLQSLHDSICAIIDFLPSLEIRGDNKTIKVNSFATGKTIEAIQKSSSPATEGGTNYEGPFSFSTNKKGNIEVAKGFLNRNGEMVQVPNQDIGTLESLTEGYICVFDELIDGGAMFRWDTPSIRIIPEKNIDNRCYPIGQVIKNGESNSLVTFPTPVAYIIIGNDCIVEEK